MTDRLRRAIKLREWARQGFRDEDQYPAPSFSQLNQMADEAYLALGPAEARAFLSYFKRYKNS